MIYLADRLKWRNSNHRVDSKGKPLLLTFKAILKSPILSSCGIDFQVKTARVGEFVWLVGFLEASGTGLRSRTVGAGRGAVAILAFLMFLRPDRLQARLGIANLNVG